MFKNKKLSIVSIAVLSAFSIGLADANFAFAKEDDSKNSAKTESKAEAKNPNNEEDLKTLKKNRVVEFIKYFNPIPNDSYKNESQDRIIKKRRFKFVEVPGANPIMNPEIGFFANLPLEDFNNSELVEDMLKRNDVNGLSVLIPWQHLEPKEFKYNWSELDQLIELVKKQNKKLIVRITTCGLDNKLNSDTPEFVFEAGAKSMEYYGTDGEKHLMPIFWDSTYLAKWSNFINAMGDKYDGNKSIHSIGITGGGILGATRVVPNFVTLNKIKDSDKDNKSDTKKEDKKEEKIDSSTRVSADDEKSEETETIDSDGNEEKAEQTEDSKEELSEENEKAGSSEKAESKKDLSEEDDDTVVSEDEKYEVESEPSRKNYKRLAKKLRKEFGMSERQLVEHWKYVADIFPTAFKKSRLNFDANPPIRGRKGQSALDEITDYLIYRYGQRVYITRQNIENSKHGFNEYRVLLKFHFDTLTGFRLSPDFNPKYFEKLSKIALVDGISFVELPIKFIKAEDEPIKTALAKIHSHLGYQLVSRKVSLPKDIKVGDPLKTAFEFVNLGTASALNPKRDLDKDRATSYKIQLEFRNQKGKPIMRSLHTPDIPTNKWRAGKPITWEEELKMSPKLKPGKYDVFMSLIDVDTKHKLKFLNEIKEGELKAGVDAPVGSVMLIQ